MTRLKAERLKLGISQSKLSLRLKVVQPTLSEIERKREYPWKSLRRRIEKFFKLPFEELWAEVPEGETAPTATSSMGLLFNSEGNKKKEGEKIVH